MWSCARALPLSIRKPLAIALDRYTRLKKRHWYTTRLLEDYARRHPENFQRFLWRYHLGRAAEYARAHGLDGGQLSASRILFAQDLGTLLQAHALRPRSVLEAGCADGNFLHYLEIVLGLDDAAWLGMDIDARALARGARQLAAAGSRLCLRQGDLCQIPDCLDGQAFDLTICAGVLRFFNAGHAAGVVAMLLRHTRQLLALSGPAHPQYDNARLADSVLGADHSYRHNLDALVERAGGRVLRRRWQGAERLGGQSIYFVFAAPGLSRPGGGAPTR